MNATERRTTAVVAAGSEFYSNYFFSLGADSYSAASSVSPPSPISRARKNAESVPGGKKFLSSNCSCRSGDFVRKMSRQRACDL